MHSVDFVFQLSIIWYFARSIGICKVQALTFLRDALGFCKSDSGKLYPIMCFFFLPCTQADFLIPEVCRN